ncbi:hypothetical protein [Hydrogenimonas sp. SS33]|uniref:hypothetical protein n=1 Tax=Hydrogenimonas leucolamina TaxID=2954236 RepID=UPI00336C1E26
MILKGHEIYANGTVKPRTMIVNMEPGQLEDTGGDAFQGYDTFYRKIGEKRALKKRVKKFMETTTLPSAR